MPLSPSTKLRLREDAAWSRPARRPRLRDIARPTLCQAALRWRRPHGDRPSGTRSLDRGNNYSCHLPAATLAGRICPDCGRPARSIRTCRWLPAAGSFQGPRRGRSPTLLLTSASAFPLIAAPREITNRAFSPPLKAVFPPLSRSQRLSPPRLIQLRRLRHLRRCRSDVGLVDQPQRCQKIHLGLIIGGNGGCVVQASLIHRILCLEKVEE